MNEKVAGTGWGWSFCDDLADFCKRVLDATGDQTLLAATMAALPELGESHNRWHVRGVITLILQGIREGNVTAAALEGLREAGYTAVKWSLPEFNARSLHPVLQQGVEEIFATPQQPLAEPVFG